MKKLIICLLMFMSANAFAAKPNIIEVGKEMVRSELKDPDSAKFRNLTAYTNKKEGKWMVCGEVNAKNAMGGYHGYMLFIASEGGAAIDNSHDVVFSKMFKEIYKSNCRDY